MSKQRVEEITLYLTQTLVGYEVITAIFGWHVHFGDKYCGRLEYEQGKGWRGEALNHFSTTIRERLKKFSLLDSNSGSTPRLHITSTPSESILGERSQYQIYV